MINRELIRIKTLQLTYAYYQNAHRDLLAEDASFADSKSSVAQLRGRSAADVLDDISLTEEERKRLLGKSIDKTEKELLFSLDKAYELYHVLLSFIVAIHREMTHRHDVSTVIAVREGRERPSMRFVNNRFARQLADNEALNQYIEAHNPDWKEHIDVVRKACQRIEQSDIYREYITQETEPDYNADRELWRKLYKLFIQDNDDLDVLLEEKSLYWNYDKAVVGDFVTKTIRRFREKNGTGQELLPAWHNDQDKDFALRLLRASLSRADEYHAYMRDISEHWDFERLAYMDVIIMQTALAEMTTFQEIPVSVSINEYVELAKLYSTAKSATYINAMLDAIARQLIAKGKMLKNMSEEKEEKQHT